MKSIKLIAEKASAKPDWYKETIKRAKAYYNKETESNRNNLIDAYDELSDEEQKKADKEIQKLLPSWGSY